MIQFPMLRTVKLVLLAITMLGMLYACCSNTYDSWRGDRRYTELRATIDESISSSIAPLWRTTLNSPVRFSPIVGYGKLFVGADDNTMRALNPNTGQVIWSFEAGGKISNSARVQQLKDVGYPMLWFTAEDGFLYALNATNGEFIWKLPGGGSTFNSPPSVQVPRRIFSIFSDGIRSLMRAVNGVTGELIWEKSIGNITVSVPMVLHSENTIIQGTANSGHSIKAFDTRDGAELWHLTGTGAYTSGSYGSYRTRLYISVGAASVSAFSIANADASNSPQRLWVTSLPDFGDIFGLALKQTPDQTDGILIATQLNWIHALEARSGDIIWSRQHNGNIVDSTTRSFTKPAIYGNFVFSVENGNQLFARRLSDGQEVWNFTLDAVSVSSPALSDKTIFIATKAGTVYAFDACRCKRRPIIGDYRPTITPSLESQ